MEWTGRNRIILLTDHEWIVWAVTYAFLKLLSSELYFFSDKIKAGYCKLDCLIRIKSLMTNKIHYPTELHVKHLNHTVFSIIQTCRSLTVSCCVSCVRQPRAHKMWPTLKCQKPQFLSWPLENFMPPRYKPLICRVPFLSLEMSIFTIAILLKLDVTRKEWRR